LLREFAATVTNKRFPAFPAFLGISHNGKRRGETSEFEKSADNAAKENRKPLCRNVLVIFEKRRLTIYKNISHSYRVL
jgi:nucleosome binding factor SPN SPT16 subunit